MNAEAAIKRNSRWKRSPTFGPRKTAHLSAQDIAIFAALARYRYLPADYISALVGGNFKHLIHRLNVLSRAPNLFVDRPQQQRANAMSGRDEPRQVAQEISAQKGDDTASTSRGEPRPVATNDDHETAPQHERQTATNTDQPRQAAATDEMVSRYVARLEGENEFLRGQITVKDEQIKEQTERARETNILIGGLQKMLTPLLGRSSMARTDDRTQSRAFEDDDHGIENRG
jgi:hypothetical protein